MKKLKKISVVMILMTMLVGAFTSDLLLADDLLEPETSEVTETTDSEASESVESTEPIQATEETKENEGETTQEEVKATSEEVTAFASGFVENTSPSDVPAYYESKTITTGDGIILYYFKGRNNNTYYRVYGSQDGAADAFYETNSQGTITSTTPVDTATEETTIAPYLLVGEIYTSVPTTITKEDTISTTVGYDVYSFDGADGEKIYVAYGYISNVSDPSSTKGWYELDKDENYKVIDAVDGKQEDINKFVLNKSIDGFGESTTVPTTVPNYYGTPVKMESDENTLVTRERVYAFTGKDGVTYYRVYGTVNGTDEGFYAADRYGNVSSPASKINLTDEEKNLKPTDNKPGGEAGSDQTYVSSIEMNMVRDGTSVWDSDDTAGNDSSNNNGIVRSFDKIGYTLDVNIQIRTTSGYTSFTSGNVYFEVTLPYTSDVAEFSLADMKWIVDPVVTEVDGKQILTGSRYFSAAPGETVFPGTRQLPFEIQVNGASNGDLIEPIFEVWMDGNVESDYKSLKADPITVSATPRYNIELGQNQNQQWKDTYDFSTGNSDAINSDAGTAVTGRLYGYGINIEIRNYDASKGFKGIELPKGKISFQIELTTKNNGVDITGTGSNEIMPLVWDYKANRNTNTGSQGRNMNYISGGNHAYMVSPYNTPYKSSGAQTGVVDGGTWKMSQTGNIVSVEVDAYKFLNSSNEYEWATHLAGTTISSTSNLFGEDKGRGVFSTGYLQVLFPYEFSVDADTIYNMEAEVINFEATSISGTITNKQEITIDDFLNIAIDIVPAGSFDQYNYFTSTTAKVPYNDNLSSSNMGYAADGWASSGSVIEIWGAFQHDKSFDLDQRAYAVDILQKFDDTAFQPLDDADGTPDTLRNANTMDYKLLYATKPGGSGWSSENEMLLAHEEDLEYFATMAALKAKYPSGVCVAVLIQGRNGVSNINQNKVGFKVNVLDTAVDGTVYATTNNVKAWQQTKGEAMTHDDSWLYYSTDASVKAKLDNSDFYLDATKGNRGPYVKTAYDTNGIIISNTHGPRGYRSGASILIVGHEAKITKSVAQKSGGSTKAVFDLDAGEREVDYVLSPTLQLANGNTPDNEILDNVTVVDTLPYGVTYVEGSTFIGGTYNQTTQTVDGGDYSTGVQPIVGSTVDSKGKTVETLTWTFTGVKVGEDMDKIYYSVIIGNAADPDNDAKHNDSFTNTVNIYADGDGRTITIGNGNTYNAGFTVTKTNATTFAKGIDQNMYEIGENIGYFMTYTNTSQNIQSNVRILDVLPYSGDWRGTKFDGTYTVDTVTIEYNATPTSTLDLAYSTNDSLKSESNNAYNVNTSSFTTATKAVSGTTVTYTLPSGITPTALYFTGSLDGQTTIKISYTLKTSDNKPANIYANDATVVSGSSVDPLYAPVVQAKVVRRTVEGVAWIDSNRNGKRETTENKLPNVKVSLYKKDGTHVTKDILGNDLTSVVTDASGAYAFTNLPSGDYYVQFDSSGTVNLGDYTLTTKQASGVGSTVNSDADAVLDGSGKLQSAKITDVSTPAIADMKVMDYRVSNLDMGVYAPYTVNKTSNPTGSYDDSDVPVIKEGQVVTYTITVDSPTANQSNLTMTDTLPSGMSLVSGSITYKLQGGAQVKVNDSAYSSTTHTITWPTLEVPKGKSEYSFKVVVDKVDWEENVNEITYENVAIAKQPNIPDQPSNEVKHKTITREVDIVKAAALVEEDGTILAEDNGLKTDPVYTELEQIIEYRLVVKNSGHDDAKSGDIIITDVLPYDTTYESGSMTYTFRDSSNTNSTFPSTTATATMSDPDSDGKMTWTLNGMSSGEEAYLTFRVKAPVTTDNPATLLVKELEKEFDNTAHLKDVQREETIYETTYTDVDGNTYKENESVYSEKEILKDSNTTYHVVKEPLLTINKVSDVEEGTYLSSGDEITYSITVKNVGKAIAKEFDIKDTIPEYTTYVPDSINYSGDATTVTPDDTTLVDGTGELTWKVEGLEVDGSVTVTFSVTVDEMYESGEREILNQAYTRLPEDPWTPSEEVEHKQKVSYEIEKYSDPETGSYVDGNQEITYFIKITNTGESTLDKAQVKDAIPEYTTYVEGSITYEGNASAVTPDDTAIVDGLGELTWDIEGVPTGETVTLNFKVKVDEMDASGERSIKNVAYVKAPEDPWKPSEEVEHKQKVAYEIEKSSNPESGSYVDGGDEITYFIKVTNTGESSLDNLQVKDAIPENTTYVEGSIGYEGKADLITPDDTSIKDGLGELTWGIENVPVGESVTLSFSVKVDEMNTEGERDIKNQAYAKAPEEEEWTPTNEVEHKQSLSFEILKSSNPEHESIVKSGDYVTYFIQVDNTGTETLRDITVTDKVPTGTEYDANSINTEDKNTTYFEKDGILTWEIPEIKPNESVIVTFRVKVTGDQSTIRNVAQVQLGEDDPKNTNEVTHTVEPKQSASIAGSPSIATGDDTNSTGYIFMGLIGLMSILALLVSKRKTKNV